jgi:RNA 3'-terminal phosphate cyclase-like protein
MSSSLLTFSGHQHLRQRLILSILSGKHVRIDKIRPEDKNPGLRGVYVFFFLSHCLTLCIDYEISLLRLLERVTNGTVIEISVTGTLLSEPQSRLGFLKHLRAGTALLLRPGIISGGTVVHDCPLSRSVGYFLEPIIILAPFSKNPLNLTLTGITTDDNDLSVRTLLFWSSSLFI